VNIPLAHINFSVDELHSVRFAPKRLARVSPPVDEALPKLRVLAVKAVAEVVARVDWPVAIRLVVYRLVAVTPVVLALVRLARVAKRLVAVRAEEEAVVKVDWPATFRRPPIVVLPETVRLVVEALAKVDWPVAKRLVAERPVVEALVKLPLVA
jgi:hypothetical protein